MQDELSDTDFTVIAVAIQEDADGLEPFLEGITFPVLLDREHVLTELYAISNVPTVIWIDADDTIVRPNSVAVSTDTFVDFTGVTCEQDLVALRRWIRDGDVPLSPEQAHGVVADLSDDEVDARLEFRVAAHLRRVGRESEAAAHFERAARLAPHDFTIRRAMMPLIGVDPFGEAFFELWAEFQAAGSPYHGLGDPIRD
ncbi:MAG: thioredoxin family protein [Acidimicrobiia bacterium]|nr:thioredoxin family protein [Acidimicrobiia bacterium]